MKTSKNLFLYLINLPKHKMLGIKYTPLVIINKKLLHSIEPFSTCDRLCVHHFPYKTRDFNFIKLHHEHYLVSDAFIRMQLTD